MNISGAVKAISTLLRLKDNAGNFNTVVNAPSNAASRAQQVKGINEVIIIPSLNAPIMLIYDKKHGTYKLA
ncbi:hypothetical protein [Caldivirga sp. UBA161]|uniref:hypothetical protein n=1 Tax=Caldivirga sp. UBA161 TaxID=1915569 RepID=UPI0025BCF59B|nr:hypothetical protein [Caldivirga sp. UBA161]